MVLFHVEPAFGDSFRQGDMICLSGGVAGFTWNVDLEVVEVFGGLG